MKHSLGIAFLHIDTIIILSVLVFLFCSLKLCYFKIQKNKIKQKVPSINEKKILFEKCIEEEKKYIYAFFISVGIIFFEIVFYILKDI